MDGSERCGACGHGEELQALKTWRDADGEGWWIHPLCAEHYSNSDRSLGLCAGWSSSERSDG